VNGSSVSGGTPPYIYDWDYQGTPGNDVFPDDGNDFYAHGLSQVLAGWYDFIVTDANGCVDTVSVEVEEGDPITAVIQVDSIMCFGGTGGIQIVTSDGPPVPPIYDWDNAATGGNDNYGGPPAVDDDQEDISGLSAGTYYLTITYEDPGFFLCQYLDTIILPEPPLLTVSAPDVALPCFGNTTSVTATPSGGTAPYTYNWSHLTPPPVEPPTVTVGVGTYIIIVTDAHGCTASDVVMVT
jgi:hypothetical protein